MRVPAKIVLLIYENCNGCTEALNIGKRASLLDRMDIRASERNCLFGQALVFS
jgi:hypothetical protein